MKKFKKHSYVFFSSKNWWEKSEKEIKYKLAFRFVPTQCGLENSKQIAKKFKELQNTIITQFEAKNKNKNYRHVPFQHDA